MENKTRRLIKTMFLFVLVFLLIAIIFSCKKPEPIPEVGPPTLISPADGSRLDSTEPITLDWSDVEHAESYFITLSVEGITDPIIIDIDPVEGNLPSSYTFNFVDEGLQIGDVVNWSVTAVGLINQAMSDEWGFDIRDAEPPVLYPITITTNNLDQDDSGNPMFTITDNIEFTLNLYENVTTENFTYTAQVLKPGSDVTVVPVTLTITPYSGKSNILTNRQSDNANRQHQNTRRQETPTHTAIGQFEITSNIEFDNLNALYTIRVTISDEEGNESNEQLSVFRLDYVPPTVSEITATSNAGAGNIPEQDGVLITIKGGDINFNSNVSDNIALADTDGITAGVFDGNTNITTEPSIENFVVNEPVPPSTLYSGSFSIAPTATLTVGKTYHIRITATDKAGNTFSANKPFKLDSIPPEITNIQITSPTTEVDGVPIFKNTDSVAFSATITENIPGGTVDTTSIEVLTASGVAVSGTDVTNMTISNSGGDTFIGGFDIVSLPDNIFTLRITAADDQGNSGTAILSFKMDSAPPSSVVATSYENDGNVYDTFSDIKYIDETFILNGNAVDNVKVSEVYIIIESDGNNAQNRPTVDPTTIATDQFPAPDPNGDSFKRFIASGEEQWTAGIDISDQGEGNYYIWLCVIDAVSNYYYNNQAVTFNTSGTYPNMVTVDSSPPQFTVYSGQTIDKYADYNTIDTAWTIADILLPEADRQYEPYGAIIDVDNNYNPDDDTIKYTDWNDTNSAYEPDYDNDGNILSIVDLDICEAGTGNKKITVEIGVDSVFEQPFIIYTDGSNCDFTLDQYNADIGYKNDTVKGLTAATGRLSTFESGGSYTTMDGTDLGTYRFNLLDFPKGTGNMIPDGQHVITYRLTDEAGNTEEKQKFVHTKIMNRPYLHNPGLGDNTTAVEMFQWYHPLDLTTNPDTQNTRDRLAFADYVTDYELDISLNEPTDGDPTAFETNMVTKTLLYDDTNHTNPDPYNFVIDDWERDPDGIPDNGDEYYEYEIESDNINIVTDEDLGTGQYYWRVRGVIKDSQGNVIYEIGSDNLPFALNPVYNNDSYNFHDLTNSNIHDLRVGNLYPPIITAPNYGEYFGTSETLTITWDPPNGGEVTDPAEIDGYRLQMRAISPQGPDGNWVDILGYYDDNTDTHYGENVYQHVVDFTATPINSNYSIYQFRVRMIDYEQDPDPTVSGWNYHLFVYTPDSVNFNSHIPSAVSAGLPFNVVDMTYTDTGRVAMISQEGNRVWILGEDGKIETSIELKLNNSTEDNIEPKKITSATETVTIIDPDTLLPEDIQVEVFYIFGNTPFGHQIHKLNHNYNIDYDYDSGTGFRITDFSNVVTNPNILESDIIDMDYYDDNLYVYYYSSGNSEEKIIQINPVLIDYIEYADTSTLTDFDGNDAIGTPTFFKLDSDGYFLIVDDTYIVTKLLTDGSFYDEYDLTDIFTGTQSGDPLFSQLNDVIDFKVYGKEMNIAVDVTENTGDDTTPPVMDSLSVDTDLLSITYNEDINPSSIPDIADFQLVVDTVESNLTAVAINGASVELTLESALVGGEDVKLTYTAGANPIQDMFGNNAPNFTGEDVTNNTGGTKKIRKPRNNKAIGVVKTFILNSVGTVQEPLSGYDLSGDGYDISNIAVRGNSIVMMAKDDISNSEKIYKVRKNFSDIDLTWAYSGYVYGGGTWSEDVISLPGRLGIPDDDSDDGMVIEDPANPNLYMIDIATQQVLKVNGIAGNIRSEQYKDLSGIAISPRVGTSRGVYISDTFDNAVYQLTSVFDPVVGGSFDDNGMINPDVYNNYLAIDDDGDPLTPPITEIEEIPLDRPMGMHLEVRGDNEYLYIADYGNERIVSLMITENGKNVTKVYNDVTGMGKPIDVAVFDRFNVMYVLTEDSQIYLYRRWGTNWGQTLNWNVVPTGATAIDADQNGSVYVTTPHGVYKWGFDEWPYWIGGNEDEKPIPATDGLLFGNIVEGDDDQSFNTPWGVVVGLTNWTQEFASGNGKNYGGLLLYTSDSLNRRIKILNNGPVPRW